MLDKKKEIHCLRHLYCLPIYIKSILDQLELCFNQMTRWKVWYIHLVAIYEVMKHIWYPSRASCFLTLNSMTWLICMFYVACSIKKLKQQGHIQCILCTTPVMFMGCWKQSPTRDRLTDQQTDKPTDQPTDQATEQPIDWPTNWLTNWHSDIYAYRVT